MPQMVRAGPWYFAAARLAAARVVADAAGGLVVEVYLDRLEDSGRLARVDVTQAEDSAGLLEWLREQARGPIGPLPEVRVYDAGPGI